MSLLTNLLDGIGRFDQFYYGPCLVSLYFLHEPGHAFVPDTSQIDCLTVDLDQFYCDERGRSWGTAGGLETE